MDSKLKHLEFIQGTINRLATNSFLLKGWSVVLVSALFALAAGGANVTFVYLAYIPAIVFWGLDGYFLALERSYRGHYARVRAMKEEQIDFSMNCGYLPSGFNAWAQATVSMTIIAFHGAIVGAILLVMLVQR